MRPQTAGAIAVMLAVLMAGMGIGAGLQERKAPARVVEMRSCQIPRPSTPNAPKKPTELRATLLKARLLQVAKEFGIEGRFEICIVERVTLAQESKP